MATNPLKKYASKRKLKQSGEPKAKTYKRKQGELQFVVQKHAASHLHYDLRLEVGGVLKSWAIPKGPSLDPSVKRLAIMVEDHPYDYRNFEGVIPSGYGAGTVMIWDCGTYTVDDESDQKSETLIQEGLKRGSIHFNLNGEKLNGRFSLVKLKQVDEGKEEWLLIKSKDAFSSSFDITQEDRSVISSKSLEEISGKASQGRDPLEKYDFITHQEKFYWEEEQITKGDLLRYYEAVAPYILPYLKDRPESLRRYPHGISGQSFFQKNMTSYPDWLETALVEHHDKTVNYMVIHDTKALLYAVNLGSIEIHPWFSRIQHLDHPDFLVLDLDPEAIDFDSVVETAHALHALLTELKVPSFCKTSGGRGLHIAIPLQAKYTYEQAKQFALLIATCIHQQLPDITSLERSPKKRQNKVYIDCFQNNFGQTLAAPYSVRARPGAFVSTPLEWSEIVPGMSPSDYTIFNIVERVKEKGDLFKPLLQKGVDLEKALKRFQKLFVCSK